MVANADATAVENAELAVWTEAGGSSFAAPSASLKGLKFILSIAFSLPHLLLLLLLLMALLMLMPRLLGPLPPLLLLKLEVFSFCVPHTSSLIADGYCDPPSPLPPAETSDPLLLVRAESPLLWWSRVLSNKNLALPRECTRTNFCSPPDP